MANMVSCGPCWFKSAIQRTPYRLFDVSKQIIGQMFVHGLNVLISDVLSHLSAGNACVLYFLNILIDTTLGKHACVRVVKWN